MLWDAASPRLKALKAEGAKLEADIKAKIEQVRAYSNEVEAISKEDTVGYRDKLEARLRQILADNSVAIDENRLLTDEPATLREIGERYNVTRERIRQLEARLLEKLKDHLGRELRDFSEDWISE